MSADLLEFLDNVHALKHLSEDGVSAVQPGSLLEGDEELRAIGVWASICHGEEASLGVLDVEVFVVESGTVDAFSSSAVSAGEVSSLGHEAGDDSVEVGTLEPESLSGVALTLLASAESAEVLNGLGHTVAEETEHHATSFLAVDRDIEVDLVGDGVSSSSQSVASQQNH